MLAESSCWAPWPGAPKPTALGTLLIWWRSVVCSTCSFPNASTSHSSKPFHFLSAFGAITNRWALVICCTLHCQQRSQDKWLTSSKAWWTWDCTSPLCTTLPMIKFFFFCLFWLCWESRGSMALVCSIDYFANLLSFSLQSLFALLFVLNCALMRNRRADIVCLRSHFVPEHVCVCRTALPTAQRPPTMT